MNIRPYRAKARATMRATTLAVAAATAMAAATPAFAALGNAPTYRADSSTSGTVRAVRQIQRSSNASVDYTVNETTLASGTVIREYVARTGTVFALAWQGPTMAPLNTLLGTYFPSYTAGLADVRSARGGGYGPATVRADGLIVESGGHMGSFSGRAWLPQALPQGFGTDDIQ